MKNFGDLEIYAELDTTILNISLSNPSTPACHFLVQYYTNPKIQHFASCMHSSLYLYLPNSNSFEAPPNPNTNHSSTTTTLWLTCNVAAPPFCPLVIGGRRREERSTRNFAHQLKMVLQPHPLFPADQDNH
jgi:hypothetical protein